MATIETSLFNTKFSSPIFLASGILGETADSLIHCFKAGAGCVVTKSIGSVPVDGNPLPVYLSTPHYSLNCMGLPNPGIEDYKQELQLLKESKVAFAGSVFSDTPGGFARLAQVMEEHGALFLELNISCPNKSGVGDVISADMKLTGSIVEAVASSVKIPVLPKLSPNLTSPGEYASKMMAKGARGFVCTNTARGMHIDAMAKKPVLSKKYGGIAGPALKPMALYSVFKVYEETGAPIIGVGGVSSGIDAAEFLLAGARAVEIGSIIERDGPCAFTRIRKELDTYMDENGFSKVEEVVGLAHE